MLTATYVKYPRWNYWLANIVCKNSWSKKGMKRSCQWRSLYALSLCAAGPAETEETRPAVKWASVSNTDTRAVPAPAIRHCSYGLAPCFSPCRAAEPPDEFILLHFNLEGKTLLLRIKNYTYLGGGGKNVSCWETSWMWIPALQPALIWSAALWARWVSVLHPPPAWRAAERIHEEWKCPCLGGGSGWEKWLNTLQIKEGNTSRTVLWEQEWERDWFHLPLILLYSKSAWLLSW